MNRRFEPASRRFSAHAFATNAVAATVLVAALASDGHPASGTAARTELPTEWHIGAAPAGTARAGTLPESATLTSDGLHVIVVDGGAGTPKIDILNASSLGLERTIAMDGAYGVPLPDASGSGFWVSTAAGATIVHADAATGTIARTIALPPGTWASSIARSPDGTTLAVSDETGARVSFVTESSGAVVTTPSFGSHLADAAFAPDGKTLFVANWGGSSLFAVDVASHAVRGEIALGRHPEHLALSPDGTWLYVSETDDDAIAVVDVARASLDRTLPIGLFSGRLSGASPTSLAVSADGKRLYVACSAANAVAVLDPDASPASALIGAIPTGWYPTFVAFDPAHGGLLVANGMGEGGRANPQYRPFEKRSATNTGYIAASMIGSIRRVAIPPDAALATGRDTALADGGPYLRAALDDPATLAHGPALDLPGARVVRAGGPIRHVIYVIKENRTYDQVLGDETAADGDAALTLFGRTITPNEHAIAERFGIFDRTFTDAEVSADGHNWSTAAFGNDYLEKMWPPVYGGRRDAYDFEDGASAATPHGGYLWNVAKRSGVTLRNYGEFTTEPDERKPVAGEKASDVHDGGIESSMADLKDETDPKFTGFDVGVSDLDRIAEWQREYEAYEASDTLPAIELVRLPNDHTAGTRKNELTPAAYVAQNDDAVGRLVDVVSHGKYWSSTAIFVLEDDAQNGADHVDAQRMTFYLASPYAAGGVQHAHYSTAGVLRTIEILLGMPPMSAYDASARPLTAAFTDEPNLAPFRALPETQSEIEKNPGVAYHARENARYDLSREDAFPAAEMNDEIWHAVAGHAAPRIPSRAVAAR